MKCISLGFLVSIVSSFSLLGCGDSKTNKPPVVVSGSPVAPVAAVKSEAIYQVKFSFDGSGGKGSMDTGPNKTTPFYGLGGSSCSSNDESQGVLTKYEFEFVDHQDGSDVYRVTRSVTGGEHDGKNDAVDVRYSGKKTSVFDDEISTDVMEPSTAK